MNQSIREDMESTSGDLSLVSQLLAGDVLSGSQRPVATDSDAPYAAMLHRWFDVYPGALIDLGDTVGRFNDDAVAALADEGIERAEAEVALAEYNKRLPAVLDALDTVFDANSELVKIAQEAVVDEPDTARIADDLVDDMQDVVGVAVSAWSRLSELGTLSPSVVQD